MWLSTRAPLSDSNLTDTIYALVFFSEPIVVNGSEPTLTFATGSHFESNAAVATGLFVGGGMSTSKGFWRNDAPNPLRSGAAQPCRAGGIKPADAAATAPRWSYTDPLRPWGPGYCVAGAAAEARVEESMNSALAFAFNVLPGHRTPWLDVAGANALTTAGTITAFAAPYRPARLTLPTPGNPLLGSQGGGGALNSLSASSHLVIGAPFVCNVTTQHPPGTVTAPGSTVDILVAFSEPVSITCGAADDQWLPLPAAGRLLGGGGAVFASCPVITLALVTDGDARSLTGNNSAALVSSTLAQLAPGAEGPPDAPALLRFRYVVKSFDNTYGLGLQYANTSALILGANSTVTRVAGTGAEAASVALPPTRFDAAGVDNANSLAGTGSRLVVIAATG